MYLNSFYVVHYTCSKVKQKQKKMDLFKWFLLLAVVARTVEIIVAPALIPPPTLDVADVCIFSFVLIFWEISNCCRLFIICFLFILYNCCSFSLSPKLGCTRGALGIQGAVCVELDHWVPYGAIFPYSWGNEVVRISSCLMIFLPL